MSLSLPLRLVTILTVSLLARSVIRAAPAPSPAQAVRLGEKETIALVGESNMERTRFHGFLQTHLIAAQPQGCIRVRNFGWEGDTVFEQWRDDGNVQKLEDARQQGERRNQALSGSNSWRQQRDWREQLADVEASVVIAQFGQMEALAGEAKLPAFIAAYARLVGEFADRGRRVVLVSPILFEKSPAPHAPDLTRHNPAVLAYTSAIGKLAAQTGAQFIDLTSPLSDQPLTDNGFQLNEHGHRVVAADIASALGAVPKPESETTALRREVIEMERLWFDYWRPMNWSFLSGDRTHVPYSRDWKDADKRIFPQEMQDFLPLLEQADENIRKALAGQPTTPIAARSSIPSEPPTARPQSPDEELASFQILDGFAVNLFASEADGVVKPIQMRWDERGRLWVACAVSYPQIKPGEKANDYVLVCEDTDGDGRADRFHKFVEGLFMPSGLELGDGGLYVAQGTELLHFADTDGDGKADRRRLVLGGFGTADSHQMINGLNWGFGGELWFTQGHHIYSRVETPYGVETLNRAGVWRWRPRTGHLDPFFQFSSAGANCWGVVTTTHGQPFHKSGANIGAYFSTPGLVRSSLAVSAQAMNLFLAPVKQVGMDFVGSTHFPPEMQGRAIIGGYYANVLEQHELRSEDGMFRSRQLPNIIETKNHVFRPVEVRSGPDGAMYVADWYNPIIGHYQASYRHPDRDKAHGRIWRVTAKGRPLVQPARLSGASTADLLEQLDSPERWASLQAKRLLFERPSAEVIAALDAWVAKQNAEDEKGDYRRLQALAVYEAHETLRADLLQSLLRASDPRIRAYATRTIATWARDGQLPNALALLEPQIADEDPLVRLEAIVAASYVPSPRATVIAARSLDRPFNAYHQHALTKALHALHPLWSAEVTAGRLTFDRDEHFIFALRNAWVEKNPDDLRNLSGAPVDYRPRSAAQAVAAIMREQVQRHVGEPAREGVWLRALAAVAGPEDTAFLLQRAAHNPAVLPALAEASASDKAPADAARLLEPLVGSADAAVAAGALRLVGLWRVHPLGDRARAALDDPQAPLELRRAALGTVAQLRGHQAVPELRRLLATSNAAELHDAAFAALITANSADAAQFTLERVQSAKSPAEAAALVKPLLDRTQGYSALQKALQKPDALPAASAKTLLQALNTLGRNDAKLAQPLMKLAGMNAALPAYTPQYVARLVDAARTAGKPEEGRRIYEQAGCAACHAVGGSGGKIGPDLSAISRGMPIDMIVAEVIWPALNVKEGYEAATVTMKDGAVLTGFKHTETGESIALRDLATGEVRTIARSDTQKIEAGGTVMPDGLTATLTEQQIAHLVRFLSELGQ